MTSAIKLVERATVTSIMGSKSAITQIMDINSLEIQTLFKTDAIMSAELSEDFHV